MNTLFTHAFSKLGPDVVLDAIESIGLRPDGRLLTLNSYENRVYRIGMEDGPPLVAKFYRPLRWSDAAIKEEHAFLETLAECEIPVVPPIANDDGRTLHAHEEFRFSVYPMMGGRAPNLDDSDTLEWLGRFVGRIHAVGATAAFASRPEISMSAFGTESVEYLRAHDVIPGELREAYFGASAQALEAVSRCYERAGAVRMLRLHGDCHVGNILWTERGPHFVDFDDSRMGPAIQDLWMLLSGERSDMIRQLSDLLAGYEDFFDFDERELCLVEALRTLRLLHYSAWLARRWDDPAFKTAFPWFNTQRYWQDRVLEIREQIAAMSEPPLWGR